MLRLRIHRPVLHRVVLGSCLVAAILVALVGGEAAPTFACGGPCPTDTPTPTATKTPTNTPTNTPTPTATPLAGRMTGGGSVFTSAGVRVTHGLTLPCAVDGTVPGGTNLEINAEGDQFHLDALTSVTCTQSGAVVTLTGTGTGTWGHGGAEAAATIRFTFTDAGEPGTADVATYEIVAGGQTVLTATGTLDRGNQQFHPAR
ncbi:MAG TPA: hypothetical protein VNK05_16745 [Chloroflexota bacterium]|nr:hypothetical protein [Chloroflexota bacterium]